MEARCMRAIWHDLGMDKFVEGDNFCVLCRIRGIYHENVVIDNETGKSSPRYSFTVKDFSSKADAFCIEAERQRMLKLLDGYDSASDTD